MAAGRMDSRGTAGSSSARSKPNMLAILTCLVEVAMALRHLHSYNIAHCDVKPVSDSWARHRLHGQHMFASSHAHDLFGS